MFQRGILMALTTLATAAPSASTSANTPASTPGVIRWHGEGVQIYDCKKSADGYAWMLRQPDAMLTDADGHVTGHHSVGPRWTATDGSSIVGRTIETIPSPATAIPWLVLEASSHDGHGALDGVTYVLRTETVGGVAPADGCSKAREGAVTTVPYQATYSFLRPGKTNQPAPTQADQGENGR